MSAHIGDLCLCFARERDSCHGQLNDNNYVVLRRRVCLASNDSIFRILHLFLLLKLIARRWTWSRAGGHDRDRSLMGWGFCARSDRLPFSLIMSRRNTKMYAVHTHGRAYDRPMQLRVCTTHIAHICDCREESGNCLSIIIIFILLN